VISMFTLAAAPCAPGTLATYIALGATGCTVGGDTFFNFGLLDNGIGGLPATAIDVGGVGPSGTPGASSTISAFPNDLGVDFNAVWGPLASGTLDDTITFDVSVGGGAANITDAGIVQSTATGPSGSSVTVTEGGCSGIVYPCTQTWGVNTGDISPFSSISDTIFSATGTLSVTKDIALSGAGANLSNVADVFSSSPVPEPRALSFLLGLGLVAGFAFRKKFQSARA